ncbi:hypothetical protein [Actinomadura terrae]|nr:hypothetical protein [Actinomadura terrae]
MAASLAVFGGFARHQVRRRRPGRATLVTPGLFGKRAFSGGLVLSL